MYRQRWGNKYGAKKTEYNGFRYDSKFEASIAQELDLRVKAGEILDYDRQYRVEIPLYDQRGLHLHTIRHKVDFRLHNPDGSFTLLEAKGVFTADYKMRRLFLEKFFLPNNLDYDYEVVTQSTRRR